MRALFCLLFCTMAFAADSYSLGPTAKYLFQEAHPSQSHLAGWIFGAESVHHSAAYFDTLSIAGGVLRGDDPYEEAVRARYLEIECKLCFKLNCGLITPYAGAGFRLHWFNFREPAAWGQDAEYLYLPLGVRLEKALDPRIFLGAYLEADLICYGKWRYCHPVFSSEFRSLNPRPGFDSALWIRTKIDPCWDLYAGLSLRYVPLSYPEETVFSPESKTQILAGIKVGAACFY